MKNYDAAFARLGKSKFRSRFHLSAADRKYIAEKGMETIRSHCEDFIRTRLAPANPPNDGTPKWTRGTGLVVHFSPYIICIATNELPEWPTNPVPIAHFFYYIDTSPNVQISNSASLKPRL